MINLTVEVDEVVVVRWLLQANDSSSWFVRNRVLEQWNHGIVAVPDLRSTTREVGIEIIKAPPSHTQGAQLVDRAGSLVLVSVNFIEGA